MLNFDVAPFPFGYLGIIALAVLGIAIIAIGIAVAIIVYRRKH